MIKRTLVFSNPVHLSLKNRQLTITYKDPSMESGTVPIEDICMVMIEHQQISITMPLLNALTAENVQVIFCNSKGMPSSILMNLDGNNTQGETLRNQMACGEVLKKQLWKQIVECKIRNQAALLDKTNGDGNALKPFYSNVRSGDSSNKEGIAARMYFQKLFGADFLRDRDSIGINTLLNYGYTVLRAAVCRALVSSGLFPAIGIFHHNRSNAFPLADDIMEPYRPFVDEIVYNLAMQEKTELTKEVKGELIKVQYADTVFAKVSRPLSIGLSMTTASLVKCYSKEITKLSLPSLP